MRGRVIGVLWAGTLAGSPLGIVLGGLLLELFGLRPLLAGIAACYLAVTLGMLLNPPLRQMDDPTPGGHGRDVAPSERGSER